MQVALEDPKRFRVEITFSRGADLSPLEVKWVEPELSSTRLNSVNLLWVRVPCLTFVLNFWQRDDSEAIWLHQEHTLPIMGPERLQEVGSCLTLEMMEKMIRPFAMPAEDFPPPSIPQGFSGYFSKSAAVLERLVNLWPFNKHWDAAAYGGRRLVSELLSL